MAARYTSERAVALSRAHFQFQQEKTRIISEERCGDMRPSWQMQEKDASKLGYS